MSIVLAATETLEIFLPGVVTTNDLHVTGSYSDQVSSAAGVITAQATSTPITVRRTNGSSIVTLVPAQGSGLPRIVTDLKVYNADTVSQTPTIQINAGGTRTILKRETLVAGATLEITPKDGWKVTPTQTTLVTLGPFTEEAPAGTINGINTVFTLSQAPAFLILFKNGIKQLVGAGNDYTLTGLTITFSAGAVPSGSDALTAVYII